MSWDFISAIRLRALANLKSISFSVNGSEKKSIGSEKLKSMSSSLNGSENNNGGSGKYKWGI